MTHPITQAAARRASLYLASTREASVKMAQEHIAASEADGWMMEHITVRRDGGVVVEYRKDAGDE